MTTSSEQLTLPFQHGGPNRFPSPSGREEPFTATPENQERAKPNRRDTVIARRNTLVAASTTRIEPGTGTDSVFSPFWLVTIAWANERCPTCARQLPVGYDAGFDEDERACFCLRCVRKWLAE